MMFILGIIQLISLFFTVVLGVLVAAKSWKRPAHRAFALFAAGMSVWILSMYLMLYAPVSVLWVGRIGFMGGSVMLAGLLWFTAESPVRSPHYRALTLLAILIGVLFSGLSLSPYMVLTAEVREQSYIFGTFHPVIYPAYLLLLFGVMIFALVHGWRGFRASTGVVRSQYFSFFAGATIYLLGMVTTNLLVPAIFNDFRWNAIGPVFSMVFLGFVAQSILYYRFFDIRWILKWGLLFPILVTSVAGMFLYITLLTSRLLWGDSAYFVTAFIVAIIFRPFYQAMDRFSTVIARRGTYVFDDATFAITKIAEQYLDVDQLLVELADEVRRDFQFRKVGILVFSSGKSEVLAKRLQGYNGTLLAQVESMAAEVLAFGGNIVEREELEWKLQYGVDAEWAVQQRALASRMKALDIAYCVPFMTERSLVGLLVTSDKASGEVLSETDTKLFKVIRNVMSPALSNAARFLLMQQLYESLKESDRAKSEFIRVVSHQFRTPLTAIRWNAELMLGEEAKKDDISSSAGQVYERAVFLADTLDRIFDILSLESGKVVYETARIPVRDVVNAIVTEAEPFTKERGLALAVQVGDEVVTADQKKFQSAFRAILLNAIGFTPSGGSIEVSTAVEGDQVVVSVKDTGIGIAPDEKKRLFQKFFRGTEASKMVPDGVGLGLFLAKAFIEGMRGSISIDSTVGKGTVAELTLPIGEQVVAKKKTKKSLL